MKMIKNLSLVAIAVAFLASCSVERRHHMSGYYVDWANAKKHTTPKEIKKANHEKQVVAAVATEKEVLSGTENEVSAVSAAVAETVINAENAKSNIAVKDNVSLKTTAAKVTAGSVTAASKKVTNFKKANHVVKAFSKAAKKGGPSKAVYIVLAIIIPFVAVGLATDWGIEVLWNILWSLLCGIPGIIHAFIILKRENVI